MTQVSEWACRSANISRIPDRNYRVVGERAGARFHIDAQTCVHCKTCDIKDPARNITWTPRARQR